MKFNPKDTTTLQDADAILYEHTQPNSLVNKGNLFYAASEYQKAFKQLQDKFNELDQFVKENLGVVDNYPKVSTTSADKLSVSNCAEPMNYCNSCGCGKKERILSAK